MADEPQAPAPPVAEQPAVATTPPAAEAAPASVDDLKVAPADSEPEEGTEAKIETPPETAKIKEPKPPKKSEPKEPNVTLAIAATVIIVLGLGFLAFVAFMNQK